VSKCRRLSSSPHSSSRSAEVVQTRAPTGMLELARSHRMAMRRCPVRYSGTHRRLRRSAHPPATSPLAAPEASLILSDTTTHTAKFAASPRRSCRLISPHIKQHDRRVQLHLLRARVSPTIRFTISYSTPCNPLQVSTFSYLPWIGLARRTPASTHTTGRSPKPTVAGHDTGSPCSSWFMGGPSQLPADVVTRMSAMPSAPRQHLIVAPPDGPTVALVHVMCTQRIFHTPQSSVISCDHLPGPPSQSSHGASVFQSRSWRRCSSTPPGRSARRSCR